MRKFDQIWSVPVIDPQLSRIPRITRARNFYDASTRQSVCVCLGGCGGGVDRGLVRRKGREEGGQKGRKNWPQQQKSGKYSPEIEEYIRRQMQKDKRNL